jgi:Uncharacterized protein conserved in bacteria (DUF2199)
MPESERSIKTRLGGDDFLYFDPAGTFETGRTFVRALLEVHVRGTSPARVVFGVWLLLPPNETRKTWEAWGNAPEYANLAVDGLLANGVPPWRDEVRDKPCHAAVRDPAHLPVIMSSSDPLLARVLTDQWPSEEILPSLP